MKDKNNKNIILSENDRNIFFDNIFKKNKPNQKLIKATKKYKKNVHTQEIK
jgi:hypothetical protein